MESIALQEQSQRMLRATHPFPQPLSWAALGQASLARPRGSFEARFCYLRSLWEGWVSKNAFQRIWRWGLKRVTYVNVSAQLHFFLQVMRITQVTKEPE